MQRLFAYAADSNLSAIEETLVADFKEFASKWGVEAVRLRNVKSPPGLEGQPPDWNLGLSVEATNLSTEQLASLVHFISSLAKKHDRDFMLGTWDGATSETELLCIISPASDESWAIESVQMIASHPWSR